MRKEKFDDKSQSANKDLVQYVTNEWNHPRKGVTRRKVQATATKIVIRQCMAETVLKVVARLELDGKHGNLPRKKS